jgi:anaerobic magnesium-protoporphyrin IX monomethyl ester cyclase
MKVLLVTTPIRPVPTSFPPFGSLALIHYLRKNGLDCASLYDIDCLRPGFQQALDHIVAQKPDVLGISAVVSTAYEYTKRLSLAVKERLPDTLIVVGGNMAASAEILLRRTGADLCVLGEGEIVFLDVVRRAHTTHDPFDFADIKGLALIGRTGEFINTGYPSPVPTEDLYDIDWSDLEKGSRIEHFFPLVHTDKAVSAEMFNDDPRIFAPQRKGKRFGFLYTSKGCVSRCTFCHRWDKGWRVIPVPILMKRLDEIRERYNVGFLRTADENFGSNHRWAEAFCREMKARDVLWHCGTRVKGMTMDLLTTWHDAGCTRVGFGLESGSARMLEVMEKKVDLKDNREAITMTQKLGIPAPISLVIGMPGEDPETIAETIEFTSFAKTQSADLNPNDLSINYAQALPGTPLYEFARHRGMIGGDPDGEEQYLLAISDKNAHDESSTLNFTDYPALITQTWRPLITIETNHAFVKKFGLKRYLFNLLHDANFYDSPPVDSGYQANPRRLIESGAVGRPDFDDKAPMLRRPSLLSMVRKGQWGLALITYPVLAHHLRHFLWVLVVMKDFKKFGADYTVTLVADFFRFHLKRLGRHLPKPEYRSLRKVVENDLGHLSGDDPATHPLRRGR